MYVYFLFWTYFSMCIGTSLLRHDSKAAVPLQSIGWTKAFCLSGNVKVHAFHCFFCEGGARANRGWSKGWNEGWSEGLRRSPKIDTNDAYLFCSLLDPLLVLLPLPFHFSADLFSSIPSPPFYMSISASTQHLHSCSADKVLGDKGVKRSEHAWKAERVKWSWGDGQGRDAFSPSTYKEERSWKWGEKA